MFRFTIRELVMLTAIVGLVLGWSLDHWRLAETHRSWRALLRSQEARIHKHEARIADLTLKLWDGIPSEQSGVAGK